MCQSVSVVAGMLAQHVQYAALGRYHSAAAYGSIEDTKQQFSVR